MYKIAIFIVLSVHAFSAVSSDEDTYKEVMRDYLEVTNTISVMKDTLKHFLVVQAQNLKNDGSNKDSKFVDVVFDEMHNYYEKHYMHEDFLVELYIPSFKKRFSLVELKEMVNFYHTPIGKKLAASQSEINVESMNGLQFELRKGEYDLQNAIKERLKKEELN